MNKELSINEQSLNIISQALNAANLKGVYNLSDSAQIANALGHITRLVNDTKDLVHFGDSLVSKSFLEKQNKTSNNSPVRSIDPELLKQPEKK